MCSVQQATALYHAAEKGDTHLVQLLLTRGANVNAPCGEWVSGARTYTLYTKLAF